MTGFGIYRNQEELQFRAAAFKTTGKVVQMIHKESGAVHKSGAIELIFTFLSGGEMAGHNYPVFIFKTNNQGLTAQATQHSMYVHRFQPGQVVKIYVSPTMPMEVRWDYDAESSSLNWAAIGVGIALLAGFAYSLRLKDQDY
jgi:predicted proteasome-type protease